MRVPIFSFFILLILNACQGRNIVYSTNTNYQLSKPVKILSKKENLLRIDITDSKPTPISKENKIKNSIKPVIKKEEMKELAPFPILNKIKVPLKKEKVKTLTPFSVLNEIKIPFKKETIIKDPAATNNIQAKLQTPITKKNRTSTSVLTEKVFSGGQMQENILDMLTIRLATSNDYTSIILDSYIYESENVLPTKKAPSTGTYLFTYEPENKRIVGLIDGYIEFSALLNNQRHLFKNNPLVKNIYILEHMGSDGIEFAIELKKNVKVHIYELKKPGRIHITLYPQ